MCFNEIGLHAQNMLRILGLIPNMVGGTYITTYEHVNIYFDNE